MTQGYDNKIYLNLLGSQCSYCCRRHCLLVLRFFSRYSFSYARVEISECATGATVHCTQVSTRENRPCMLAVCQLIPRYIHLSSNLLISSNLKDWKCCQKEVIGPYFQDQHKLSTYDKKISDCLVEGRSLTVKRFPDFIVT